MAKAKVVGLLEPSRLRCSGWRCLALLLLGGLVLVLMCGLEVLEEVWVRPGQREQRQSKRGPAQTPVQQEWGLTWKDIQIATLAFHGYNATELVRGLRGRGKFEGRIVVVGDGCTPAPPEASFLRLARPPSSTLGVKVGLVATERCLGWSLHQRMSSLLGPGEYLALC
mmetsp:Transcript_12057/g.34848  ORF Transcript_12057/g.34848 Transcript_12057/m.34848 type:complete len:168 (-) Transcript_12057:787-1290(-)